MFDLHQRRAHHCAYLGEPRVKRRGGEMETAQFDSRECRKQSRLFCYSRQTSKKRWVFALNGVDSWTTQFGTRERKVRKARLGRFLRRLRWYQLQWTVKRKGQVYGLMGHFSPINAADQQRQKFGVRLPQGHEKQVRISLIIGHLIPSFQLR